MKARLGVPQAITATAHKFARSFSALFAKAPHMTTPFLPHKMNGTCNESCAILENKRELGLSLVPLTEAQPQVS